MSDQQRTIQFSLNQQQREALQAVNIEGESLNITAKRLLLSALGLNDQKPVNEDKLEKLEEKLTRLNAGFEQFRHDYFISEEILGKDYKSILQRLAELENLAKDRGWFNTASNDIKIDKNNPQNSENTIKIDKEDDKKNLEENVKQEISNSNLIYEEGDELHLKDGRIVKVLQIFKDDIKVSNETLIPFKINKDEILGVQQKVIDDEMPPILSYLYGVFKVSTTDNKLEFWTGKKFTSDPEQMKLYKNPPTEKTMNAAKNKAFGETVCNNYCNRILLKMMNFPHLWDGKDTVKIAQAWADKNLIKE